MKILTEADVFTASVTVPENGDPRDAPSVETPFQALVNRTRNLANRLARREVYCQCTIPDGTGPYSGGALAPLSIVSQSGGFTVASSRLVPPTAGKYLVQGLLAVTSSSTSNPAVLTLSVLHAAVYRPVGAAVRFSASPSGPIAGCFSIVVDITSTDDRIGLYWDNLNPTVSAAALGAPQILMRRID